MKRIITVQDISCVGKCSLTVALPVISAMGVEACVLPTAVLSTHTAFKGFTFRDLTSDLAAITEHWKQEKIHFDAIYTGYLGSFEQIDLIHSLINDFGKGGTRIIVDPDRTGNSIVYGVYPCIIAAPSCVLSVASGKAERPRGSKPDGHHDYELHGLWALLNQFRT